MTTPTSIVSRDLLPASIAIYLTVALAAFEGTAFAAAIPQMAADLGDVSLLPWVITGFLLTSGVATVISGRLIDSIGVRSMFRIAVILFAGSGTVAALATSMPVMITLRVLQGAGAGMAIAVGLAAVSLVYPSHLTGRAYAANSTVWGVMGVTAPAIAAFILTAFSWRWILAINLPLGLVALVAGWTAMPAKTKDAPPLSLDATGIVLAIAFSASLLAAVESTSLVGVIWAGAAAFTGWWFYRRTNRVERALVERKFLAGRPFGPLALAISLIVTGAFSASAFLPVFVRAGRMESEVLTALSVLFFTIGWTSGAIVSSRLLDRKAESVVIGYGFASTVPGLIATAILVLVNAALAFVFAALYFVGVGIGLATNASLTLLQAVSRSEEVGRATSAHQYFRNQGFTLGSALGGALLFGTVNLRVGDAELIRAALAGTTIADASVPEAVVVGFALSALVGAAIAALGLIPLRTVASQTS